MATTWKAPTWRMPNDKNQNKFENYSLDFDGINSSINCGIPTFLNGKSTVSVSLWVKFTDTSTASYTDLLSIGDVSYGDLFLRMNPAGSARRIEFGIKNSFARATSVHFSDIASNTWIHLMGCIDINRNDGTDTAIFLNGVQIFAQDTNATISNPVTENLFLGKEGPWNPLEGSLSEVAIWDTDQRANVSSLYNSGSPINPMTLKPAPIANYLLGGNASTGGDATNTLSVPNVAVPDASVFDFDGSDDFVSTNFNVDNYTNLTYSVWVNPTSLNQRGGLASLSSVNNFVTAFWDGSGGKFYVYIGNVLSQITGIWSGSKFGTLGQEKWLHIAVVYDGSGATDADRLKVYADGDYVAFNILGSIPTSIPSGGGDLIIGKWTTSEYDGKMSNVMLFDSSLPATGTDSVETLYNNGVPLTTAIATDNLKAWYKLDQSANWEADTAGNWQIPDAVSSYPQSFDFIPTDDRISINELQFTGEFSLSMWINPKAIIGSNTFILGRWDNNFDNDIKLSLSNNTPVITLRIGGGGVVFYGYTTSSTIPLNEWSHLSIIRNSSNDINCYLNGVQFSTTTGSSTNTLTLDSIGRVINTSYGWDGRLSNIAMWDTALTPSQLYNNGVPLTTAIASDNLKAWYKLDNTELFDGTNWEVENQAYPAGYESALDFPGTTSDKITLNTFSIDTTQPYTISAWVNLDSTANQTIISGNASGGTNDFTVPFGIRSVSGSFAAIVSYQENSSSIYRQGSNIAKNELTNGWHHVMLVKDGVDCTFYYDGQPNGTSSFSTTPPATINLTTIGKGFNNFMLNGRLSNLAIWQSDQSININNIYNNGTPQNSYTETPISLWKLNNTTTGIQDSVGSNNGTISGNVTKVNTFVSTEAGVSSGMTEQNLVNNNVSALNGESSGMDTSNLVTSTLTRQVPYNSYSLNFDSVSSDYIDLGTGTDFNFTGPFTLSVWAKKTGTGSGSLPTLFNSPKNSSNQGGYILCEVSNIWRFYVFDSGTSNWKVSQADNTIVNNTWYNITAIYDGSIIKLYVNGVLQADTETVTSVQYTGVNQNAFIGEYANSYFNGVISNVSLFNQGFTSTEVLKLYNSGVPSNLSSFNPSPIAWWSLGSDSYYNGTSWICPDLIGNNNGTSNNMDDDALIGDAPNSTANGTSTNMTIDANLTGSAPNSSNNSFSVNMSFDDRETNVPS